MKTHKEQEFKFYQVIITIGNLVINNSDLIFETYEHKSIKLEIAFVGLKLLHLTWQHQSASIRPD